MKNRLKIIMVVIVIFILLISWVTMVIIDRQQTLNLEKPIFARLTGAKNIYKGIGYTIKLEEGIIYPPDVGMFSFPGGPVGIINSKMHLFGFEIAVGYK